MSIAASGTASGGDTIIEAKNGTVTNIFGAPFSFTDSTDPPLFKDGGEARGKSLVSINKYGLGYSDMIKDGVIISLSPKILRIKKKIGGMNGIMSMINGSDKNALDNVEVSGAYEGVNVDFKYWDSVQVMAHAMARLFKKITHEVDGEYPDIFADLELNKNNDMRTLLKDLVSGPGGDSTYLSYYTFGAPETVLSGSNEIGESTIINLIKGIQGTGSGAAAHLKEFVSNGGTLKTAFTGQTNDDEATMAKKAFYNPIAPMVWKDSASQSSYTVNMKFSTPYGDSESILRHIMVPIVTLLPFLEPRDVGKGGGLYRSPYAISAYCPGHFDLDLGMVTSMEITTEKYNAKGMPTSVNVCMTITDLLPVTTIPDGENVPVFRTNHMTKVLVAWSGMTLKAATLTGDNLTLANRWDNLGENVFNFFNLKAKIGDAISEKVGGAVTYLHKNIGTLKDKFLDD